MSITSEPGSEQTTSNNLPKQADASNDCFRLIKIPLDILNLSITHESEIDLQITLNFVYLAMLLALEHIGIKIENVSFKILLGLFTGRKCIKDKNFKFDENWKELIDAYDFKASNENTEELINGEKILFFSKSDDSKLEWIKNFSYLNYGVHSESANYKFFRGSQKCKCQLFDKKFITRPLE